MEIDLITFWEEYGKKVGTIVQPNPKNSKDMCIVVDGKAFRVTKKDLMKFLDTQWQTA